MEYFLSDFLKLKIEKSVPLSLVNDSTSFPYS